MLVDESSLESRIACLSSSWLTGRMSQVPSRALGVGGGTSGSGMTSLGSSSYSSSVAWLGVEGQGEGGEVPLSEQWSGAVTWLGGVVMALVAARAIFFRKRRRTPSISLGLMYNTSSSWMDPKPEDDGPLLRYTLAGSALAWLSVSTVFLPMLAALDLNLLGLSIHSFHSGSRHGM